MDKNAFLSGKGVLHTLNGRGIETTSYCLLSGQSLELILVSVQLYGLQDELVVNDKGGKSDLLQLDGRVSEI
ncbi:hypothetical protein DPMN_069252 [Dreissena polymorpha]|uniref:Uncharacterized protein n=1 Tax=Dreissena polymorpha TaxID=45954 RepID=A0A9D4BUU5_DREPO|nr:hypothetical protein DPMN_069252 [Dreissena polymorpha]